MRSPTEPPGAILPLGGVDLGHKGFGLGLMIEALTAGLAGFGRSDAPASSSNTVFILVADPDRFGGGDFFRREMTALAASCRAATQSPDSVHLPGEHALARRRDAMSRGIEIDQKLAATLAQRARVHGVPGIFAGG